MRKKIYYTSFLLVALLLATVAPVAAITYGEPDGDDHPNVGALIAEWREPGVKEQLCTGTLIDSDVFLTAAHCTAFLQSSGIADDEVWVSFAQDVEPVDERTLIGGTMVTHPDFTTYNDPGGQSDPHDIAVILLDRPVNTVVPASLPTEGLLDQLHQQNGLKGQKFTNVGYGVRQPELGGEPVFPFDGERWRSVSEYRSLENAWLHLSQNDATDDGGTCYGDSGGPQFLGAGAGETNIVVSITVTGDTMCLATNVTYRTDTPSARAFLGQFVTLP